MVAISFLGARRRHKGDIYGALDEAEDAEKKFHSVTKLDIRQNILMVGLVIVVILALLVVLPLSMLFPQRNMQFFKQEGVFSTLPPTNILFIILDVIIAFLWFTNLFLGIMVFPLILGIYLYVVYLDLSGK
ncbi:MAG: hypothetical protein ABID38_06465 [Candidatus Diapherotrites archaeon]